MSDAETGRVRISLMKFLKGDKRYIPGNTFNYTFEGKDLETGKKKALEALLVKKKRIQKSIKNLTTKDKLMQLHPNALVESNLIEERFFIPKKEELIRNKDLEPWEQSHYIQAPTIVSKLQSLKKLYWISTEQKNFYW